MSNKQNRIEINKGSLQALPERIHFKQFILMHPELELNEMQQAGFKVTCNNKEWMRENEWMNCYTKYKNKNK